MKAYEMKQRAERKKYKVSRVRGVPDGLSLWVFTGNLLLKACGLEILVSSWFSGPGVLTCSLISGFVHLSIFHIWDFCELVM